MAILAFVIGSLILMIYGTALISNGVLLGCLTLMGLVAICSRVPKIKDIACRFPLVFEIGSAALTYMFLGGSVTGLIAAAVVGLGTSALIGFRDDTIVEPHTEPFTEDRE